MTLPSSFSPLASSTQYMQSMFTGIYCGLVLCWTLGIQEKIDMVPVPWSLYSLAEDRHESSKLYIVVSMNEVDSE